MRLLRHYTSPFAWLENIDPMDFWSMTYSNRQQRYPKLRRQSKLLSIRLCYCLRLGLYRVQQNKLVTWECSCYLLFCSFSHAIPLILSLIHPIISLFLAKNEGIKTRDIRMYQNEIPMREISRLDVPNCPDFITRE